MMVVVMRNEKMSLCLSKRPLHTFLYIKSVMKAMRIESRLSRSSLFSALSMQ